MGVNDYVLPISNQEIKKCFLIFQNIRKELKYKISFPQRSSVVLQITMVLKQTILGNTVFKVPEVPQQYRSTAPIVTCECFSMIPTSPGADVFLLQPNPVLQSSYTLRVQSKAQISSYCLLTQKTGVMCARQNDIILGQVLRPQLVLITVCFISLHFASEIKHNLRLENSTCPHNS